MADFSISPEFFASPNSAEYYAKLLSFHVINPSSSTVAHRQNIPNLAENLRPTQTNLSTPAQS